MRHVLGLHAQALACRAHALRRLFGRDQQFLGASTGDFARRIDACGHAVERFLRAHGEPVERDLRVARAARCGVEIFGARLERGTGLLDARFGALRASL